MEKEFYQYSSIENTYQQSYIDRAKEQGYAHIQYLITEKVHGSNVQLSFDGSDFTYGTRNHYLCDDEKCYNFQEITTQYHHSINSIYHGLKSNHKNLHQLIIFGEICGGSYPHEDVPNNNKSIKVQKGVYYSPDNVWLVFDMCMVFEDGHREYVPQDTTMYWCEQQHLPHVPILCVVDSLDEALEYPNNGLSIVYKYYNLPPIEDNIMEGVVIKPYKSSPYMGQSRVIFKNKNDRFKEKSREKKVNVQVELPEHVANAVQLISEYVTENRVSNAISHYGQPTMQDIGAIIKEVNLDVIETFNKDTKLLNTLEKDEQQVVRRSICRPISQMVREQVISKL